MCGIAGLFAPRRVTLAPTAMARCVADMTGVMSHRGPDASGVWSDPRGRCVLGHRRLSVIDTTDASAQPMVSDDGRTVLTFNGEIYNYLELRPQLEAQGRRLRRRSDTETLLEGLAAWGTEALRRLDGMFAFACFDTVSGELLLARDPFGEKPLYYTTLAGGAIAFASELQALERCAGFDARVDVAAMAEVLSFQYIGSPRSIYGSVRKLPPGHWLRIDADGATTTGRYFSFRPGVTGFTRRSLPDLADELEDILLRSISRRMISDVPLGAFLSGGVDSSTVCALIRRRLHRPLKTFSMGFLDAPESEHQVARAFAEHLGTEHFDQVLAPDASGFMRGIGALLDEPNADSSCLPTFLLSRFAREQVTVAVSGDGGDEMFGGYGRYFITLEERERRRAGELGDWWTPGGAYYGNRILVSVENEIAELFGFVPAAYGDHLARLRGGLDAADDQLLCGMRRSDAENYMPGAVLPKVDRMSMQCSLEVRTPFLTAEVARFAERLPDTALVNGQRGKLVLREIAYRYLPRALVDLPKKGFAVPMSDWARSSMLDVASELLECRDSRLRFCFGPAGIERFLGRQRTPGRFSPYQVWGAVMLESWLRHHPVDLSQIAGPEAGGRRSPADAAESQAIAAERDRAPAAEATAAASGPDDASWCLAAYRLRGDLFVARRVPAAAARKPAAVFDLVPGDLAAAVLELLGGDAPRLDPQPPDLLLPVGDAPPGRQAERDAKALAGATLVLADADAARRFGPHDCEQLRRIGVARVLMLAVYQPSTVVELQLRRAGGLRDALATLRLLARPAGVVSNGRLLQRLGATGYSPDGGLLCSGEVAGVDAVGDCELSDRYFVYEGLRQLPPLHRSHADVRERDGFYSVWNQRLLVRPIDGGQPRHTFRLVRADERSRALAAVVRHDRGLGRLDSADVVRRLGNLVAAPARDVAALRPGDPLVVCTHGLPPGGAERQWVYLAQSLKDLGFEVTFVVYERLERDNHYLAMLRASEIRVIDGASFSTSERLGLWPDDCPIRLGDLAVLPMPSQILALAGAFRAVRPKAVFLQLDPPNTIGAIAALVADVGRIVLSFRNYNPSNFPYLVNDWYQRLYRLLCASPRVLLSGNFSGANEDYARWIGIDAATVAYVPNAVDEVAFELPDPARVEAARRGLGLAEGTPVLLGAFRLSAEKDPLAFVEVFARVASLDPDAQALLVGVGPMEEAVRGRIGQLGLDNRIRLLGNRADLNVLMRLASVFLLTSRLEGMPNVLMEAQLMATPVVATDVGGVRDVADERSGITCAVGDVEALAAACLRLLGDRDLARAMGEAGRRRMVEQFPKAKLGQRYLDLVQRSVPAPSHQPGEAARPVAV